MAFPVKQITTEKTWEDLKLREEIHSRVHDMINWVKNNPLKPEDPNKPKPTGCRALFYGPPKSGKKTTAAFIAKETGRDIYKIDLSQLTSKYIGDTEKNLEIIFARAEEKGWILYFDEADELFGKKENGKKDKDDDDKYSGMEMSYLLNNIWHYPGLVIVVAKKKKKIDEKYLAKFDSMLDFDEQK